MNMVLPSGSWMYPVLVSSVKLGRPLECTQRPSGAARRATPPGTPAVRARHQQCAAQPADRAASDSAARWCTHGESPRESCASLGVGQRLRRQGVLRDRRAPRCAVRHRGCRRCWRDCSTARTRGRRAGRCRTPASTAAAAAECRRGEDRVEAFAGAVGQRVGLVAGIGAVCGRASAWRPCRSRAA